MRNSCLSISIYLWIFFTPDKLCTLVEGIGVCTHTQPVASPKFVFGKAFASFFSWERKLKQPKWRVIGCEATAEQNRFVERRSSVGAFIFSTTSGAQKKEPFLPRGFYVNTDTWAVVFHHFTLL